jgi:hypothetical protein
VARPQPLRCVVWHSLYIRDQRIDRPREVTGCECSILPRVAQLRTEELVCVCMRALLWVSVAVKSAATGRVGLRRLEARFRLFNGQIDRYWNGFCCSGRPQRQLQKAGAPEIPDLNRSPPVPEKGVHGTTSAFCVGTGPKIGRENYKSVGNCGEPLAHLGPG